MSYDPRNGPYTGLAEPIAQTDYAEQIPSEERVLAVRVPEAKSTVEVEMPRTKALGIAMLLGATQPLYFACIFAAISGWVSLALAPIGLYFLYAGLANIVARSWLILDERGVRIKRRPLPGFSRAIPLARIKEFSASVKRRVFDNREVWSIVVLRDDGKTIKMPGAMPSGADAAALASALNESLLRLRGNAETYRVAAR